MSIQIVRVKLEKVASIDVGAEKLDRPDEVLKVLRKYLDSYCSNNRENVILVGLDTKFHPTFIHTLAVGSVNSAVFKSDEIFRLLLLSNSTGFIIAHNHPTGDCTPSKEDVTNNLVISRRSVDLGFSLVDNIIFSNEGFYSFTKESIMRKDEPVVSSATIRNLMEEFKNVKLDED